MSRVKVTPWIAPGTVYLMVDVGHPEQHLDQADQADGTIIVCHPDDERLVRDALALAGEHRDDVNAALTILRRGARG